MSSTIHAHSDRGRRGVAAVAAATLALALAACSGSSAAPAPTDGAASAPSDATISIAITSAPRSLDPAQLDGGNQAYVWASIYDTLLYLDNAGEIQPNAAESWEYSEDGRTLTLSLREGMTFSSGDPVDAEAVAATLERNRTTPGQQQSKLTTVEAVEAVDAHTVEIRMTEPDPALLSNLAMDLGVIADPATIDSDRTATDPIGSGPYLLDTERSVSGSSYVLERREDYWNVDAYPFQTVTMRVLQDQTAAVNALRSGEVDVSTVPANQLESLGSPDAFNTFQTDVQSVVYLNLADRDGTSLEPLGDVRVRQAINHAFDREEMVTQLLSGVGMATEQMFNPRGEAYLPELEGTYDYDPERARELLAEAGYPDGFDVSMPSTVFTTAFEPTISQFLGDIGIDVTWAPTPAQNATASVIAREFPMYMFIVSSEPIAPREIQRQLHSNSQNPFEWTSPELEELEHAVSTTLDPDEQDAAMAEVGRYTTEQALFAPLMYTGSTLVTSTDVRYLGDGSNVLPTIRVFEVAD